ncbi:TatD family hydrolase [uncultured Anaerovibrio sp.]|uniref:TatD family hydrolase n=1 Tax=uncultured Anaerovibrio sp. TaxID=361586 RepID=UPI00261FD47E|nr:TatD family hydrolase [uncultured Anaerovibrio sp.]
MEPKIIDTHAHVNSEKFDDDRAETIERAQMAGIEAIVNMGDTMESSQTCMELSREFSCCYAGVGIHPEEAFPLTEADLAQLAQWADHDKVVAIGEIGLDYYWEKDQEKRQLQREIFIKQLDLARQLDMPVCIHNREAHGDTMNIIKAEGRGIRGVLHCFSGSLEMARELVKMGWYIGVDGPLTFKNAAKLPEIVQELPLEALLVETDCPYMAPVPMRGKRNEPAYVKNVVEKIAQLRNMSFEEIAEQTTRNAKNLYTKLS